jgi:hypothetical protein
MLYLVRMGPLTTGIGKIGGTMSEATPQMREPNHGKIFRFAPITAFSACSVYSMVHRLPAISDQFVGLMLVPEHRRNSFLRQNDWKIIGHRFQIISLQLS